jgi:hypothetical protein
VARHYLNVPGSDGGRRGHYFLGGLVPPESRSHGGAELFG